MNFNAKTFLQSLFETQIYEVLPAEWIEEYEERAGILEYDGCLARQRVEDQAKRELQKRIKKLEEM